MSPALCLIISGLCFVVVHASVKFLPGLPAHELVFFRALISCSLSLAALRLARLSPWGHNKKMLLLRGFAGTIALLLYFRTLQVMPLASAVTIQYLHPIFTVILAGIFLKEKPTWLQWVFFAASFGGVLLVEGFDGRVTPAEALVGVAAAMSSAVAYNLIRALRTEDHALVVVFYLPFVNLLVTAPLTMMDWVMPQGYEWSILILIGVFTQIAQYFMTLAYQGERASNISNLNYLGIVYALVVGWLVWNESVEPMAFIGMGIITLSAILSTRFGRAGAVTSRSS
ncbi:MAG: DMT family transporter [Bdellovibrionota bacterium]